MFTGVSVIIPNYNNEKYIEKCIESVVKQSYENIDVIVVDDYSTDNSREIITALANKYDNIIPIFLDKNQGVSHARNVGIERAKTEYITCLDGDDFYFNKDKIKNEVELLEKKGSKSLAYSATVFVAADGATKGFPKKNKFLFTKGSKRATFDFLSGMRMMKIPRDYIVSKEVVLTAGKYDESMNLFEDFDLLVRLSFLVKFECTYEFGTAYRQTGKGLSSKTSKKLKSTRKKIIKKYFAKLKLFDKIIVTILKIINFIITFLPRAVIKTKIIIRGLKQKYE